MRLRPLNPRRARPGRCCGAWWRRRVAPSWRANRLGRFRRADASFPCGKDIRLGVRDETSNNKYDILTKEHCMHALVLAIIGKIYEVRKRQIGRMERRSTRQYIDNVDPKKL